MPAVYAHYVFGNEVYKNIKGELKDIITKNYDSFVIGLQGPDLLLYHRPYMPDQFTQLGDILHKESFSKFLTNAVQIIRKVGVESAEYAYLIGFITHFVLDSEVHPYVDEYADNNDVTHVYMESEFDKYILKKMRKDPMKEDLSKCIPHTINIAKSISSFYKISTHKAFIMLYEMFLERKILYTPSSLKYNALNFALGTNSSFNHMVMKKEDHTNCFESNMYLYRKLYESVDLSVQLIYELDATIQDAKPLHKRFYRDFETVQKYV